MKISLSIPLLFILIFSACGKEKKVERKPPRVKAAYSVRKTVPYYLEGIGHVRAYNSAQIKSQVEGYLQEVHYEQGKQVKAGEPLVTIYPENYKAMLKEAEGMLEQSIAELKFAEDKVMRYTKLAQDDYVSQLNYDQFVSNYKALLGTVKKNQGAVENAKTNLEYCYIRAPFDGKIGKRLVDIGNLVQNDGSVLLIINQIQPIFLDFSLPEKDLTNILMKQNKENLVVKALIPEVEPFEEEGELIVVGNYVDETTGMIPLRAQFKNEKELLWPGQFAKVRLILKELQDMVLVPEEALNLGQKGFYVEVVGQDEVATIKYVKVGERYGGLVAIEEGLEADELVITDGQLLVEPGKSVNVVEVNKDILKEFKEW